MCRIAHKLDANRRDCNQRGRLAAVLSSRRLQAEACLPQAGSALRISPRGIALSAKFRMSTRRRKRNLRVIFQPAISVAFAFARTVRVANTHKLKPMPVTTKFVVLR